MTYKLLTGTLSINTNKQTNLIDLKFFKHNLSCKLSKNKDFVFQSSLTSFFLHCFYTYWFVFFFLRFLLLCVFEGVSSSYGFLRNVALFYCCTPCAFHITIFMCFISIAEQYKLTGYILVKDFQVVREHLKEIIDTGAILPSKR